MTDRKPVISEPKTAKDDDWLQESEFDTDPEGSGGGIEGSGAEQDAGGEPPLEEPGSGG